MSAPALDDQIRPHLETLEAAPGDVTAFKALEALYEGASRWDDLVALYELRAEAVPEPGAPALARAAALSRTHLKNVGRSEALWRRVLQAEPAHAGALRAMAELLEEREDWPALAAALEREASATADPKEAARRTYRAGRVHEERLGRRDRAALLYARACRIDPALEESRTRALACFVAMRRFGQAKRMLDTVRDLGADRPGLAAEYARLGALLVYEPLEHGLAMDCLIEALALDRNAPGAADARERLKGIPRAWREEAKSLDERAGAATDRREAAALHLRLAQLHVAYDPEGAPRALERIERAWALSPGDTFALDLLARAFAERGDHRGHADALARLVTTTRDRAAQVTLHLETAQVALVRFGDADGALAALERALELDPACESAALQAFEHHVDAGRFDRALSTLERHLSAAREKSAHAPLRVRSAQLARERLNDVPRARRHLEAALRADPGHVPAATALAPLLADAGEWPRLAGLLEGALASGGEPGERIRLLERLAEVQQERLGKPKEALRTLSRALALDPGRAATRKAMEGAAARADAFAELARAYRSAADALTGDVKARKTLLRRVAEICDRDLGKPEEAVRAWRTLIELDPEDRGAQTALDACLARAGQQEELARSLDERRRVATGDERRALSAKLGKLLHDAARHEEAAGVWREVVTAVPEDDEALWGLHAALEALPGVRAAEERVRVLAALAARQKNAPERAALELARAELLSDPVGQHEEAATVVLAALQAGGIGPGLQGDAVALLEKLAARGAEPLRIAQALAPVYAAANEPARLASALELIARRLPAGADPRERARAFLDASSVRSDRLGDLRGALSAAAAALRASPDHAEARRRCEDLARQVGAQRELFVLLVEAAQKLDGRPEDEAAVRVRAAAVAEEDLGASDEAGTQLRRALALRPGDPAVLASLTRVALAAERWREAADLLAERATHTSAAEKAALLAQRADVLHTHLGEPAAAAAALRQAVDLASPEARARMLGRLAAALGDAGDAAGRAKALGELAASGIDPAEATKAALESARIEVSLGDPVSAAERLSAAHAASPDDGPTLAALEQVLEGANPEATLTAAAALAHHPDPRRRARALEARARVHRDPAERAGARAQAAKVLEQELRQPSLAFAALADAVRDVPGDPALRAELRRLAVESQEIEACAKVYDDVVERTPAAQRPAVLRERAEWAERRRDPDRAAEAWARVLAAAPGDREALSSLRRLHRARERWGELAEVCAEIGRRAPDQATRQDAAREEAAVAETRLRDPARAATAWSVVAGLAPGDGEAQAALERLYTELDRPQDLAIALERRLARAFDLDTAARLAELRRTRLGDAGGALALHAELVRRDPGRSASVDALAALAAAPGPVGREALAAAEPALAAAGDHARRVAAREARLGVLTDAEERAHLLGDIRAILEHDLGDPAAAFAAARRGFAEGGPARADAEADLERLGRSTGKLDELAEVWEEAARAADPRAALELRRRVARLLTEHAAGTAAVGAWKRVLEALPADAEAHDNLEKLYAASRSAGEILELARARVAQSEGPERLEHLLHAGRVCEELGDPSTALEAYRAAHAEDPGSTAALEGLERILSRGTPGTDLEEVQLALAGLYDPQKRLEVLLRRAATLETDPDPRRAVEAHAELLAERPNEPAAVAGLERLLARPDARDHAARALEDVFRAAGDTRRLVALLELRLEGAEAFEKAPLLAEAAALHERLGDRRKAFLAKAQELALALSHGSDAPAVRAELERLAAATGAWGELASVLESASGAPGLPLQAALDIRKRLAAVAADRLGRLDAAARWYEEVAHEAPTPETLGALSRVYRKLSAHRDLARTLGRLAEVAPGAAARKELLLEVAKIMAEQLSDRDGAVDAYRKILAVDPEDPNALRLLGKLLGTAERWEELAEVLGREVAAAAKAGASPGDLAELRYRLGRIRQLRLSDPAGALADFHDVLARSPRHPGTLSALEELARGSGDPAIGAAALLEPVYIAEGEHQKLVETLEARAANEAEPVARAALLRRVAETYGTSMRNAELAFVAAGRALAADPDSPESLECAEQWSGAAGASHELAALLAENADRARDPRTRAELLRRIARLTRAEPARAAEGWQRVLDILPEDPEACHGLVEALRGGQEPEAFAQALRRALAIEPDDKKRTALLADLAAVQDERLDDTSGAILTTKRLLELRPEDREALGRLDRLCVRTERWVDLADVLAREISVTTAAGDAAAALGLRQRLAELKESRLLDKEGALALYEEVLKGRPDHPEAIARLEAWLQRDPGHPRVGFVLEMAYAAGGDAGRQAAVLELRAGERPDATERKTLYLQLADVREKKLNDPEMAFLAICKAFREDPGDPAVRARLEKLAEASGHDEELCAIYQDEVDRLPPRDAAAVSLTIGRILDEKLSDPAGAAPYLRRAQALDPEAAPVALPALERIYTKLESWPELADVLSSRASPATGPEKVAILFKLGQLAEEMLEQKDRAADAYEAALAADPRHLPSLRALEALYEGAGRREDLYRNLGAQRAAGADPAARERVLAKMAALAVELGKEDEAVALWRELLTARPRHDQALAALEELFERTERWSDLAAHLRLRLSATVDRREVARLNDKLGLVLGTRLGDMTQAVASYKAVLDSDPRNRRALESLRDIHAAQGDQEALAGVYRRLVPLQEDAAGVKQVRLELAEVLLRAGNKREATEQAKLAFDIEPHAIEELARIEEVFRQTGAGGEGVRAAEARAALLVEKGGPAEAIPAWLAVADLWKAQKRPDAAAAALDKVLELDPANRTAFDTVRAIHQEAGNWRLYARVSELFAPQVADPVERLGFMKEAAQIQEKRLGQKDGAFLAWSRVLAQSPGDEEAFTACERLAAETEANEELAEIYEQVSDESKGVVRAQVLLRLGKLRDEKLDDADGAESAFRRALESDPGSPEALGALTHLFQRRGRVRELVITLEQKLEAAADMAEKKATLVEVARLYDHDLSDVDEAIAALKRVLELDGSDAPALEALTAIYRREARWPDLAAVLSRARDLAASDEHRIAYQLAIASLHENEISDEEAAVEAYRTVLGLDDRNVEALAGLERLYTKLDRFAELNRVYERQVALAEDPREQARILAKSAGIQEEKLHDARAAIEKNEQILALDGQNLPAIKALARLYRDAKLWDKLITVLQHHLTLVTDRREQVALEVQIGEVWYKEMARVDRAESIFNHALQLDPESRQAVSALGRLYERSGNWNLALDMLKREARIAGGAKDAVEIHVRMGAIFEDMLLDSAGAKEAYQRALALDPGCLPAVRALKGIAERGRDRGSYLEMLIDEARYATDPAEKSRLYTEVARIHQEEKDDREGAARYYEEALKRAPGHLEAARPLADIYIAQTRWTDAERVLDAAVEALAGSGDPKELCRQCYRQGYVAEKLGKREKALASHRRAFELDSTYLPALEGLGHLLVQEQQWDEALRIFTTIIIHHRDGLTDLEVVETHWQIGEISDRLGQTDRAAAAFKKALEIDANHEPSRKSLVRVLETLGDWEGAVDNRQRLLAVQDGQAKFENYVALGEACRDRLKDAYQAIDAFLGASRIDPTSLPVTEALLGLYRETRQGQKAADVLSQLLTRPELQADPVRAAQMHLSLAEILRTEVKDEPAALAELERALDANPRLGQAFGQIEELLTAQKRWPDLEQAYVRMIARLPKTAEFSRARTALWRTLGELYRTVLHDEDGARTAYQVVVRSEPEDAAAAELYAGLAAKKPGEEGEAVQAYRQLIQLGAKPKKAASALVKLLVGRREFDPAYSAAQVLAHLVGGASQEELQVVSRLRKYARDQASRAMDDALWDLAKHDRVKGPLADILTLLAVHARSMFVQKEKDLGLSPKRDEIDVQGSMLFFVNMFKYVERTLGFQGLRLFRKEELPSRIQLLPTEPIGLAVVEDAIAERPKKELWFALGKAMTFARPEMLLARLMPHDQLDLVFQAACSVGTSRFVVTADPHLVEKLKREMERTLPEKVRKNALKVLARNYCDVQHPGDVRGYLDGAELTSNRVAALLTGDLEVVKRGALGEKPQVSKLREDTRVRDLEIFCVSDAYTTLRDRLGLSCVVPS